MFDGKGTLKLGKDSPEQKHCIMVRNQIYDLPQFDQIETTFINGIATGISSLTWSHLRIKMDAYLDFGMMHGLFRVYNGTSDKWMISSGYRNQIDALCWIISPKEVIVLRKIK